MKLRNKKTGEIVQFNGSIWRENNPGFLLDSYDSLQAFLEEYEDVPEEVKSWAEEVKVRELPSGLKIADLNYYEIDEDGDKKTEFTWDEAMERFKDDPDWRLPTPKELNQMVLDLGYNDEGVFEGELFAKNLGEDSLKAFKENGSYGLYWSSTPDCSVDARGLSFYSTYVYPQSYSYKPNGFTVRCVAR
ncbi:DUF1566 domain-containing protein [Candidatus Saccharibacteria bacterium]|nr:DUF1566 domain-containing protein [Candidatus Saccharibacteria bacterium]